MPLWGLRCMNRYMHRASSPGRLSRPSFIYGLSRKTHTFNKSFFQVSEEVQNALNSKKPVVALETAIYTHGFPYPENVALASRLESLVRINGGVPATIGVLNGIARVGLQPEDLIDLASSTGRPNTIKVSRRDLGQICGLGLAGRKLNGGTTVSGTMVLAQLAGIPIFATGGLGGVHRGGETSLDISADLTELGRTRVVVVSSGCKSFLDIPRTLEYLETQGVGVCTFSDGRPGQVDFPAFWSRDSGVKSPITIQDEQEAASIICAQYSFPISSGLLFANPVPEEYSISRDEMDAVIERAIQDAEMTGSTGSSNTPYVLSRIREITDGRSVAANRALVEANVIRGTRIAVKLVETLPSETAQSHAVSTSTIAPQISADAHTVAPKQKFTGETAHAIVAGSLAVDLSCNYRPFEHPPKSPQPTLLTSNPAAIEQSVGGVGHNVATAISYLDQSVTLCSKVADDIAGKVATSSLVDKNMSTHGVRVVDGDTRTAQYVAVNDANKDLMLAMADMSIFDKTEEIFEKSWKPYITDNPPKWLVVDGNWDASTLRNWLRAGHGSGVQIAFEPVSIEKAKRLFASLPKRDSALPLYPEALISITTPNSLELAAMFDAASSQGYFEREDWFEVIDSLGLSSSYHSEKLIHNTSAALVKYGIPQQSIQLSPYLRCILTTLGEDGVLLTELLSPDDSRLRSPDSAPYVLSRTTNPDAKVGGVYMRLYPPVEKVSEEEIVSVNGVGDTFLGALIAGLAKKNAKPISDIVNVAQKCSVFTLKTKSAVSPDISRFASEL